MYIESLHEGNTLYSAGLANSIEHNVLQHLRSHNSSQKLWERPSTLLLRPIYTVGLSHTTSLRQAYDMT